MTKYQNVDIGHQAGGLDATQDTSTSNNSSSRTAISNPLELGDLRFRSLVGTAQWQRLPIAVQARFCKRLADGKTAVYSGKITQSRTNRWGTLLGILSRIIGSPLPRHSQINDPVTVSVSEDTHTNGQYWTRIYGSRQGFPQVIHSVKRFTGTTGLEEYIGYGIGMALTVECASDGIRFSSDHYFLCFGRHRFTLPGWLTPGKVTVSHINQGSGRFMFVLNVQHHWFGELLHQQVLFTDLHQNQHKCC